MAERPGLTWRMSGLLAATGAVTVGLCAACAMVPPQSFLDPTAVGKFPDGIQETGIRRILTPREVPIGYANATEPTPQDLIPQSVEYRIGPGDTIGMSIDDLIDQGRPYAIQQEVNENGYLRIPRLGQVYVAGMTESELEQEIVARLRDADLVPDPVVIVLAQVKRNRYFSILGDVLGPGSYGIPQNDFRLLDAIGLARGLGPNAKKIRVIRRLDAAPGTRRPVEPAALPAAPRDELVIPPPELPDNVLFSDAGFDDAGRKQDTQPARDDGAAAMQEVASPRSRSQAEDLPPLPQAPPAGPRLIFDPATGQTIEVRPDAPATRPEGAAPRGVPDVDRPFDWDSLPEYELTQRVIEIDADALQSGDPRMNIVIRDRDTIRAPFDTGVFYLMGEVNRPGVYGFGGRSITMKQALGAIGAGFTPLAWPSRVEVIRRERGTDKQITIPVNMDRVFAGLDEDVEIQDDDLVNVGTHILAPFLFVIRNSFRFTYGFGFVYDRNFADKDAYSQRLNPEIVQQSRRANRGLPF